MRQITFPHHINTATTVGHFHSTRTMEITLNKCRWLRVQWKWGQVGKFKFGINLRLNPVVTFISAVMIWAFVVWCMVEAEAANRQMSECKTWITDTFTWMYIGTQDAWALFILVLYFSKYGKMKLGKPDDKPEFNDATYFTMLFAAGIGIGLFYFGVGTSPRFSLGFASKRMTCGGQYEMWRVR